MIASVQFNYFLLLFNYYASILIVNVRFFHSNAKKALAEFESSAHLQEFAVSRIYDRLRSRPLLFKTVSIVKNRDFVVHFFLFPYSITFLFILTAAASSPDQYELIQYDSER